MARPGKGVRTLFKRLIPSSLGAVLLAAAVLAYVPALRCGFVWDDSDYVQNNHTLRSLEGLGQIWFNPRALPQYYPLVHTSYWIEYHLWGLIPAGYHAVNVALHALGALLAWRVLAVLRVPGAWVAAAVFALHPVQVESVAWITERKNVLSSVLYCGAALAYLRFALREKGVRTLFPAHDARPQKKGPDPFFCGALLLFAGALLSKTVTCSLPAALLLVFWWQRRPLARHALVGLIPFFALGLASGLLTVWLEKYNVGAAGEEWHLSLSQRTLIAGRALWFYAGKLIWPTTLTFIYPRWPIDAGAAWQYIYPAAAVALVITLWLLRTRLGRGPLAAVLFFGGTLFPALGFFDVYPMRYSFVADHFQYLASLGLIALGVATGARAVGLLRGRARMAALAAVPVVLIALGILTWRQQSAYVNLETLWRDTLRKNPDAWMAHNNLGNLLQARGELDAAREHHLQALRLRPDDAPTHNNLAGVLIALGRPAEALDHCRTALQLRPDYPEAHCNLGMVLAAQGNVREAVAHYRAAVQARPDFGQACNNLAWILATDPDADVRNPDEAVRLAERASELAGQQNPAVLDTLAAAYASAGQFDGAIATAQRARSLATAAGAKSLAETLASRIELYRQRRPYRTPADPAGRTQTRPALPPR